ncbi:hypothetical protein L798_12175 [Zootermopsis nevadensis]|uniref:Uncharacterized protein n=1 Tax=Zootermopsis nevadensis TaxID=136037 RepID=A0A067RS39_ZOONE|nr:hypothetical protein L798_12175 [Zootermopsis nevadensis]
MIRLLLPVSGIYHPLDKIEGNLQLNLSRNTREEGGNNIQHTVTRFQFSMG